MSTTMGAKRTPWRLLVALLVFALVARIGTALLLREPGYFDGYGYLRVAQRIAHGDGMTEDFVWQHVDRSEASRALPHASHLYWMPMTSWLAAAGLRLFGASFVAAQAPFIALSALLPPASAWLSHRLYGSHARAVQSAIIATFLGAYLARWVDTEPCTPFALAAGSALLLVATAERAPARVLAGALAGAAHLSRADGFLVPLAAVLALASTISFPGSWPGTLPGSPSVSRARSFRATAGAIAALTAGYALFMAPWLVRQHVVRGSVLPEGALATALFVRYDDMFAFETPIDAPRFFAQGAAAIVKSRVEALGANVAELAAAFDLALLPLAAAAAWILPRHTRELLRPIAVYAILLLAFMTLVTPYPARFGSLYRSSAALVPWVAALAPAGVAWAARGYARWRGHEPAAAMRVVPWLATVAVVVLGLVYQARELGVLATGEQEPWNARLDAYRSIGAWLDAHDARGPVLTTNPPGFTLATQRAAVMIPSDGAEATAHAADRFGARHLVLESNLAWALPAWRSGAELPGFRRAGAWRDALGASIFLYERAE